VTKQEIKSRLLEAIKTDPYHGDIKSVALFGSYITGEATDASDAECC
jgi:predicted nucleotidyltransferase